MSFARPIRRGGLVVEDGIDDLHFEKMIARAERAALIGAAHDGAIADRVRLGAVEAAVGLGVFDVALDRQIAVEQIARRPRPSAGAAPWD